MVTNTDKINSFLKPVSYLNGLLINAFFENWQGQKIINFSQKIFQSAYVSYNIKHVYLHKKFEY